MATVADEDGYTMASLHQKIEAIHAVLLGELQRHIIACTEVLSRRFNAVTTKTTGQNCQDSAQILIQSEETHKVLLQLCDQLTRLTAHRQRGESPTTERHQAQLPRTGASNSLSNMEHKAQATLVSAGSSFGHGPSLVRANSLGLGQELNPERKSVKHETAPIEGQNFANLHNTTRARWPRTADYLTYDGDIQSDHRDFLNKIDLLQKSYALTDWEIIAKLPLVLKDAAADWFSLKFFEEDAFDADWSQWKLFILERYETDAWKRYMRSKLRRSRYIPGTATGSQWISRFIRLNKSIEPDISLDALKGNILSAIPSRMALLLSTRAQTRPGDLPVQITEFVQIFEELASLCNTSVIQKQPPRQSHSAIARDQSSDQNEAQMHEDDETVCHKCHKLGHIARFCEEDAVSLSQNHNPEDYSPEDSGIRYETDASYQGHGEQNGDTQYQDVPSDFHRIMMLATDSYVVGNCDHENVFGPGTARRPCVERTRQCTLYVDEHKNAQAFISLSGQKDSRHLECRHNCYRLSDSCVDTWLCPNPPPAALGPIEANTTLQGSIGYLAEAASAPATVQPKLTSRKFPLIVLVNAACLASKSHNL
jgi:hypothetical protein